MKSIYPASKMFNTLQWKILPWPGAIWHPVIFGSAKGALLGWYISSKYLSTKASPECQDTFQPRRIPTSKRTTEKDNKITSKSAPTFQLLRKKRKKHLQALPRVSCRLARTFEHQHNELRSPNQTPLCPASEEGRYARVRKFSLFCDRS